MEWYKDPFSILGFVAAFIALLITGYIVGASVMASGEVSFCYIQTTYRTNNGYKLYSSIDWQLDTLVGTYVTIDEALVSASKIGCKIGKP